MAPVARPVGALVMPLYLSVLQHLHQYLPHLLPSPDCIASTPLFPVATYCFTLPQLLSTPRPQNTHLFHVGLVFEVLDVAAAPVKPVHELIAGHVMFQMRLHLSVTVTQSLSHSVTLSHTQSRSVTSADLPPRYVPDESAPVTVTAHSHTQSFNFTVNPA